MQADGGDGFAEVVQDGERIRLEYRTIAAARAGAPLLVVLHEGLGSVSAWRDFPDRLCAATGMHGLVYSRGGYGRSTPRAPATRWPLGFMDRQAREVLPALFSALSIDTGVTPPWLFGHSDGGSIALMYAAAFPQNVAGVIAVAPHTFVEDVSIRSIERARDVYRTSDLRERLARHHADVDSAFWGWNDMWLDPDFRRWSIEPVLPSIRCPLLAVQGYDDEYGTMAQIERIAHGAPQTQLLKLAACGHSPHRDQPEALIDAARMFIERHSAPA